MEANEFVQESQSWVWRGSPLKQLHWLRIIIDESHNIAGHSHKTNVVHLLDQIHVERRWVVLSRTPSTRLCRLCGVEVGLASQETQIGDTERLENVSSMLQFRKATRKASRKATGNAMVEEFKDIDKLQLIVVNLQPWSTSNSYADDRDWSKYVHQSLLARMANGGSHHRFVLPDTSIEPPVQGGGPGGPTGQ